MNLGISTPHELRPKTSESRKNDTVNSELLNLFRFAITEKYERDIETGDYIIIDIDEEQEKEYWITYKGDAKDTRGPRILSYEIAEFNQKDDRNAYSEYAPLWYIYCIDGGDDPPLIYLSDGSIEGLDRDAVAERGVEMKDQRDLFYSILSRAHRQD